MANKKTEADPFKIVENEAGTVQREAITRKELVNGILHPEIHDKWQTVALDGEDVLGKKAITAIEKANSHATINEDGHFSPTASRAKRTVDIEELAKDKKALQEKLASPDRPEGFDSRRKADIEEIDKNIAKHGKEVSGNIAENAKLHFAAIDELEASKNKLLTEGRDAVNAEVIKLKKAGIKGEDLKIKTDVLEQNYHNFEKEVKEQLKGKIALHEEHIEKLGQAAKKLEEHSGIKTTIGKVSTSVDGVKTIETAEKGFMANIKGGNKWASGLGTLALLHGGYKLMSPELDEKGERKGLGFDLAEASAGALALLSQAMNDKNALKLIQRM